MDRAVQSQEGDIIGEKGVGPGRPVGAPDAPPTGRLTVVGPTQDLGHAHFKAILTLEI